uniref:hypothetical protein n=1 Tax=Trichocoleus desertorum TaxID=1481672 RepID=UPI0025B5CC4C|nr:hypothetical protein [Trichocoleus desertorum]
MTTPLEAMQALVSIHESLEKLSHLDLDGLNSLESAAFQAYYQLVRQKMLNQDAGFLPSITASKSETLVPTADKAPGVDGVNASVLPALEEKSKAKPAKKSSTARTKSTTNKKTKAAIASPSQDPYDQVKTMFDEI